MKFNIINSQKEQEVISDEKHNCIGKNMTGLIAEAIEGIYHKQPKTKDNLYIVDFLLFNENLHKFNTLS